jgi:predicted transcriptional regulator
MKQDGRTTEIRLAPDQEEKLARIAAAQGRKEEALVREAVERLLSYDDWFSREVDKGIAAADRGELLDHNDVRRLIDDRYPA